MDYVTYVRTHRQALLRFATVLTGQAWLADDIVADVLGRAYERWSRIGAMAQPHAYVRRMVVNDFLSWRRRLTRTQPSAELDAHAPAVPDGSTERAEREAMLELLDRLPRRQRAAVVLRYYTGLTDAQIADELGCRHSTVRSQISRALAALRIDLSTESADRPELAAHSLETR